MRAQVAQVLRLDSSASHLFPRCSESLELSNIVCAQEPCYVNYSALSMHPRLAVAVHSTSDFMTCPALQETGDPEVSD